MNSIGKKIMVGSIAASVVLGGAGYLQNKTFAASAEPSAKTAVQAASDTVKAAVGNKFRDGREFGHGRGGFGGGNLIKDAAEILSLEESAVRTQLEEGKTLAEIAASKSVSKEAFLQKLIDAETARIQERLSDGTITDAQAAEQKENLSGRLEKAIDQSGIGFGGHGKGHGMGVFGRLEGVAEILGLTEDELKAGLDDGKSIAELAEAKGMTEEDLIRKLKDNMIEPLKQWVNEKHAAPSDNAGATKTGGTLPNSL
ncbi:hypothetical protein [Paenibacillus sp. DMB20]|uniref:hypothetical protein n=1 Tax=Paenibacillus sp. DMB20 TaxID=1642570 RepID=UPI000627F228|nr:hypothetical protein [Paenibacillus sp. DMB20]KKO54590.1 hypothetical protein XI25_05860 [Paenibacillus sp. DMB20]